MNNEVKFQCNDSALPKVIGLVKHLAALNTRHQKRIIRIGGEEEAFDGNTDEVSNDITVNGMVNTDQYVGKIPNTTSGAQRQQIVIQPNAGASVPPVTPANNDVEDFVKELIAKRDMFTAWDVTKGLSAKDGNMKSYKHNVVKRVVHEMYGNGGMPNYRREVVEIDGIEGTPFLYYPDNSDIATYFSQHNIQRRLSPNAPDMLTA